MKREAEVRRQTAETAVDVVLSIEGRGRHAVSTGIPFFDHMLRLFAAHGFFDLKIAAKGDIEVDFHHTMEDVGLVLGEAFDRALGDRKGIRRFGFAPTPMDEALARVTLDLSKRPYLVYHIPRSVRTADDSFLSLAKEFFRAFATRGGMNLHIEVPYGENNHHISEAIFKSTGRAMDAACTIDERLSGVLSTKGTL